MILFLYNFTILVNHNIVKEGKMTQKELLYIEDTLGHLKTMEDLLSVAKNNLEDEKLKKFVSNELSKTKNQYKKVYALLEV